MPLTTIANYYLDPAIQSADLRNSGDFVASGDIAANSFVALNSDGTVTSIQNKYSSGITSLYGLNNELTSFFSGLVYNTYKVRPQAHRLANGNIIIFFKNGTQTTDTPSYVIFNSSTNTISSIVSMSSNGTSTFQGTGSGISPNRENAAFATRSDANPNSSVEFFTYNQTSNSSTAMSLGVTSTSFNMPRVCYINDLTIFGIARDNSANSFIVQTYDLSGSTLSGPTTFSYSSLGLGTGPGIVNCRGLAGNKVLLLVTEGYSTFSLIYDHATDTFSAPTTVHSTFSAVYGGMTRLSAGNIMYFYQGNNDKISRLDIFDSAGNVVAAGVQIFEPDSTIASNFNRVLESPSGDIYLIITQVNTPYSTYLFKIDSSGNLIDTPKVMIKTRSFSADQLYAEIINDSSILFSYIYGDNSFELVTDLEPYVVIGYVEQAVTSGNSAKVFLNEQVLTTSLSGNSRIPYYIQSNGTLSTALSRFPAGKSFGSKLVLGKE